MRVMLGPAFADAAIAGQVMTAANMRVRRRGNNQPADKGEQHNEIAAQWPTSLSGKPHREGEAEHPAALARVLDAQGVGQLVVRAAYPSR